MLLPKQIWKDIPGYEGLYQVSNTGRVRSLNYNGTRKTKVLKQGKARDGYKKVGLYKNSKQEYYLIHRLVALTFIPNPLNLPQVNHINEIKDDNRVSNLEWCTAKYNSNYGTRLERRSQAKRKPILMFTKDGQFIRRFNCVAEANKFLGKDRNNTNIGQCIRSENGQHTAWGYRWIYEMED